MAAPQSYTEDMQPEQTRRIVGGGCGGSGGAAGAGPQEVPMLSHEGAIYPTLWEIFAPYLLEFVGVFILTTTFIYNYGVNKDPLYTATSNGLMVMSLTYALSHVSGANLNPSVTMSLLLTGRYTPRVAGRLFVTQMLGAIAAACVSLTFSNTKVDIGPKDGHTMTGVLIVEILYTAMLCFVFLNCAASNKNNPVSAPNGFVGLAVGFVFVAGGYAAREISNSVMNSAIAAGLCVVDSKNGFSWTGVVYFFADTLGAFIGTAAFRVVRPEEDNVTAALKDAAEVKKDADSAKVFAEFIGTFFVIFTKALNRIGATENAETDVGPEAWSVAAALTAMVYSLRDVSGGYFNPAVTLSSVLSGFGACSLRVAFFYMAAQVTAALAASSFFTAMNNGQGIVLQFGEGGSVFAVMFAEGAFSFLITYVVLSMSAPVPPTFAAGAAAGDPRTPAVSDVAKRGRRPPRTHDVAGFAYGACHTAGGFAIGSISGCLLNPAVVLAFTGVDLLKGNVQGEVLLYIFYQVFGSLLAMGAFFVTHAGLYRQPAEAQLEEESKATA